MALSSNYSHPLAVTTTRGRKFNLSGIRHQTWTDPIALDADGFINTGVAGPDTTTATYVPGDSDWDGPNTTGVLAHPRNVTVNVTHGSSIVAVSGTITGTDMYGNVITEAWSVTATGTDKTYTGVKAFKTVTSISITAGADASTDTMKAGWGKVFGLDMLCAAPSFLEELEDLAAPTAGVVVAGTTTSTADRLGTYTPNSAPNGALDFDLWYLVDNPQFSRD